MTAACRVGYAQRPCRPSRRRPPAASAGTAASVTSFHRRESLASRRKRYTPIMKELESQHRKVNHSYGAVVGAAISYVQLSTNQQCCWLFRRLRRYTPTKSLLNSSDAEQLLHSSVDAKLVQPQSCGWTDKSTSEQKEAC